MMRPFLRFYLRTSTGDISDPFVTLARRDSNTLRHVVASVAALVQSGYRNLTFCVTHK